MSLDKNQLNSAIQLGGTIASVLPARNPVEYVPLSKDVSILPEGARVDNMMRLNINLGGPENGAAVNTFNTATPAFWDFVIRGGSLSGPIQDLQLVMDFTVSTAAVTLVPTYALFRSIQFMFNSSTVVGSQYSNTQETMADVLNYLDPDTINDWCILHNCDRNGTPPSLAVGSYQFVLDLKSTIVSAMKYETMLFGNDELRIRLFPNAIANNLLAGVAANIVCTNAVMFANVNYYSAEVQQRRLAVMKPQRLLVPYVEMSTFQAPGTYTLNAGSRISFPISGASGLIAGIYLYALPVGATPAQQQTLVDLDTARFQYLSNTNEILMQEQSGRFLRYDACRQEKQGYFLFGINKVHKYYPIMFVGNSKSVSEGAISGCYFDNFNGSIVSVTPTTTVAGNYNFYCIILYNRTAQVYNGRVEISSY
jgi:hypothetical protein